MEESISIPRDAHLFKLLIVLRPNQYIFSTKQRMKCLAAKGHNIVPLVRLVPVTPKSQIEHSITPQCPQHTL